MIIGAFTLLVRFFSLTSLFLLKQVTVISIRYVPSLAASGGLLAQCHGRQCIWNS